uniref:Uncharacterized protein n=1 Tax=Panagrolaimus sp. PS1159 TaxID=55785 RepID=A0AC35F4V9_9BILA
MKILVGKKCGIDPFVIDNLDLENVVERTIAFNEGKELPPDTNEEPLPPKEPEPDTPMSKKTFQKDENDNTSTKPPSEACPLLYQPSIRSKISIQTSDLIIQNPTFETISQNSSAFAVNMTPFLNEREIVAIDIDDPEEFIEEPAINFHKPLVVTRMNAIEVPQSSEIALPQDLSPFTPIMIFEDSEPMRQERRRSTLTRTPSAEEPKKFKEKREKYGRDPQKLYETYQEEWGRLERLGTKLATRRRSVLVSPTPSPQHTGSPTEQMSPGTSRKT